MATEISLGLFVAIHTDEVPTFAAESPDLRLELTPEQQRCVLEMIRDLIERALQAGLAKPEAPGACDGGE
jgi:hypothetical protein